MNTNKVFIGDVHQIYKIEVDKFETIKRFTTIKKNAILYRRSDGTFIDLESNLVYGSLPNKNSYIGEAVVLMDEIKLFNSFIDESLRCTDIPKRRIKKMCKSFINKTNEYQSKGTN